MQQVNQLIRTKLRQPLTRPGFVSRPRLQARIAEGLLGPLTLVIAPAGFGKTTLVAASLAGCTMQTAWLSLDRDDNQAGRFMTYLIAALQGANHQVGSEAAQLAAGMQQALPEAVLTSLVNDLDAVNEEMVLVLDDYQFITSPEVHAAVAFLLDHCPHTFHLLIATRSDPPLPIARLRARGQLVDLRAADLRFTPAEAAQFLNDIMGLHLDPEFVTVLEERTEGWAAGLQMAALSMREREDIRGFIDGFSGTNRHILDYLLEEVLASQSPQIQHFLLYTSVLERLAAPLCEALMANDERQSSGGAGGEPAGPPSPRPCASVLEYLERENLFLVALDDEQTWYRYHHLFADLLRARLQQAHPAALPRLHQRASAWLEQKGLIPEAIHHLLAAHEDSRAADLIERYGPARWAENDLSVVQMADSLPRELLINRPRIGLYQAWLFINQGIIEKAYPLLTDMARQPAAANPDTGLPWIRTITRLALAFLTPPSSPPGMAPLPDPQVLDTIPADEWVLRDAAEILYGMALGRRGENDRAAEFAHKSIQRKKESTGMQAAIPTLVPFLATIYLFQGRLHAAAELVYEYLDPIKEKGIRISTAGNMDIILGDVLYEWNCLVEAENHVLDGLQANEPWGNIMTDSFGLLALAHILLARGDHAGAMQVVEKFETRLRNPRRPVEFSEDFRTLRVRTQLAGGDLQSACRWADQIHLSEDYQHHPEYYRLTLACIRLAQGCYTDVEELLAGKPTLDLAGNRVVRQIESNLLLAVAIAGQGRLPEAFRIIESCLALTEPEDYIQIYLRFGDAVRDLLAAYLRYDHPGHQLYAQKLLNAFSPPSGAGSPGIKPAGLVEALSGREMEVLQLIAQGRTNQEIAKKLIVAPGTIKAHAASIYRKLDAANRTEAVARARKLEILP